MQKIEEAIERNAKNVLAKGDKLQKEARKQTITYIVAAFGLVAGLAWNDAIKALIEYWFPLNKDSVSAKFIYALLITVVLVIITMYLARLFKNQEE